MGTKRVPLGRRMRWRITPAALKLWALILEIQAHPRNRHGELRDEADRDALRNLERDLSHEVGYSRFEIRPNDVGDEPYFWIRDNPVQMERWQQGKEIHDLLNRALLTQATASEPREAG